MSVSLSARNAVGRPCKVCSSGERRQIEKMLSEGAGVSGVSTRFSISPSSLYRHIAAHLAPAIRDSLRGSDTLDTASILGRIQNIADDALSARRNALATGSPLTALKAAETERKALESLSDRYGIDSMETIELLQESKRLYRGIAGFIESHPDHASLLISEVEKMSPDFAVILRQVQSNNNKTIGG